MKQKMNINAMIGFVLSIFGVLAGNIKIVLFASGFVFSLIGLIQINERGEDGKAFAIIGLVIDSIALVFFIFAIMILSNSGLY